MLAPFSNHQFDIAACHPDKVRYAIVSDGGTSTLITAH